MRTMANEERATLLIVASSSTARMWWVPELDKLRTVVELDANVDSSHTLGKHAIAMADSYIGAPDPGRADK